MISLAIGATIRNVGTVARSTVRTLPNPRSVPAIAERLRLTREALDLSQSDLCRRTGVAANTYNQWENAKGRPGLDQAMMLCDGLGVTLDWIYFGDPGCLPYAIASKILH